jgi:hypothetical protein
MAPMAPSVLLMPTAPQAPTVFAVSYPSHSLLPWDSVTELSYSCHKLSLFLFILQNKIH